MAVSWTATTFFDGEDAEMELSQDRPRFIQRRDIMTLIPINIKKHIVHPGDNGQIQGFQELFVHLERSSAADELRALIVAYFEHSPQLRAHLKNPTANPTLHHTILAVNPPPPPLPAPGIASLTGSSGSESQPQRQDSVLTVFAVDAEDAEDAATDTSSAPTSPVRETYPHPPSRAASMAVNAKAGPTKLHRDLPRIEPTPLPLSLMNQRLFLAFGADPADEKLHTFHFKGKGFTKHSLGIDLLQTHQTYHKVNDANVAFLAYKLRCHERDKRPEQLVLHGTLRVSVAEFTAIWPSPPSGTLSVPQLAARSLTATISASLGIQHFAPSGGFSYNRSSNLTWLEDRFQVETVFENTNPRNSFKMTIRPKLGQKEVPDTMAFAVVVRFSSEPVPFAVDFDLARGKNPQAYTAIYDGKSEILKLSDAIQAPTYA